MRALTALGVLLCASSAQLSAIPQFVIHTYAGGAAEFGVAHKLQSAAVGFNLSVGYSNVSVRARLYSTDESDLFEGTATLLDALGPSTTPNIIDQTGFQAAFSNSATNILEVTFFTGLSLGPGSYYLVLQSNPDNSNAMLWQTTPNAPELGTGVTSIFNFVAAGFNAPFTSQYIPDTSGDKLQYMVLGDTVPEGGVPEPSTWLLLTAGLGALLRYKRAS